MSCKQIIEIATVLAQHGAHVQEDKVNQNECLIEYSLHNLSKINYIIGWKDYFTLGSRKLGM